MNKTESTRAKVWGDIEPSGKSQKATGKMTGSWETLRKNAHDEKSKRNKKAAEEREKRRLEACELVKNEPEIDESDDLHFETSRKNALDEIMKRRLEACELVKNEPEINESDKLLDDGITCFRHMESLFKLLSSKTENEKDEDRAVRALWCSSIADFAVEATIALIQADVLMPITKNYSAGKKVRGGSRGRSDWHQIKEAIRLAVEGGKTLTQAKSDYARLPGAPSRSQLNRKIKD